MEKLVYIDHSYHQKTLSTAFLLDALRDRFHVTEVWDDSWREKTPPTTVETANELNPDVVVIFQVLYSPEYLAHLICKKVLLVPMYDACANWPTARWKTYADYFFLSFSRTIHRKLRRLGIPSYHLMYFPDPADFEPILPSQELQVFFWERTKGINWSGVNRLMSNYRKAKFVLHRAPDPKYDPEPIHDDDLKSGRVATTTWFSEPADYRAVVNKSLIYIAPRLKEGIGMSFLEAMAMGCVVVAEDAPTMNEYIQHRRNGLLVHWVSSPILRGGQDLNKIGSAARASVVIGRQKFSRRLQQFFHICNKTKWPKRRLTLGWYLCALEPVSNRIKNKIQKLFVSQNTSRSENIT